MRRPGMRAPRRTHAASGWAAKTITKFKGADADKSGWLTAAEYATTAPPPPKHPARCQCQREAAPEVAEN